MEIKGKYGIAKVMTENIEQTAQEQLKTLLDQPYMKGNDVLIMPDVHAGKGATIGTSIKLNNDYICPSITGIDLGCLDKDTEFLTPNGWKKISEWDNDEVLEWNDMTDTTAFHKPYAYIVKPCKEFYHFKTSKGLDQMVSEEHRIQTWRGGPKKGYYFQVFHLGELAKKGLGKSFYSAKTVFEVGNSGIDLSDEEIRVDIMIQADGTLRPQRRGNQRRVEVHFRKERKIKRAEQILKDADIVFDRYNQANGTVIFAFYVPDYMNKTLSKYWRANAHQLRIVVDECMKWDGHEGYRSNWSSTNKKNIDLIQYAFASVGVRAGINKSNDPRIEERGWAQQYTVIPTKNPMVGFAPPHLLRAGQKIHDGRNQRKRFARMR